MTKKVVMKVTDVYIQQREGTYVAPCGFSCHEGFRFLGKRIHLFEESELPNLPLTPGTLVHGWVRTVQRALTRIGKPVPSPVDYPDELQKYLAASVRQTTLGEIHASWSGPNPTPVFIKPVAHKQFTGHTVEKFSHLGETSDFPKDTPVWAADVVDHVSEYRCFVHENALVGFKYYRGDPWLLPDKRTIIQMIRDYAPSAPVAYGLDVGLVGDATNGYLTRLVETNDCFSLGNYGFDSVLYCEMLESRWLEMMS
jgi:hypothetical protein